MKLRSLDRSNIPFTFKEGVGTRSLVNQISILLAALPIIYVVLNVIDQGWSRITLPVLVQPLFFLLPIAFNYLKFTTSSKIWLCWLMPLQALTFSIYNKSSGIDLETSHYIGVRFSILASSVIPFLVFRLKETQWLILSLSLPFIALMWFDSIHEFFGVGYYQSGLHERGYSLTGTRVFIAFVLIAGSSMFLKKFVERNEKISKQLIDELTDKGNEILTQLEKIESQNDEISAQRDQLASQKQVIEAQNRGLEVKVEEKTRDILRVNTELEKQNFQLEQFAFMAAHNLRSPVARIIGLTDILTKYSPHATPDSQVVEMIRKSSLDLDDVIRDLISVVQIKSRLPGARQRLKVSHVLNMVLNNLSSDIQSNRISIDNRVKADLEFEVDAPLTNAVFTSIVNNSIRYRHEGRVNFISFRAKERNDSIELQIADNGIGFDSELYRERIFKPFSRFDADRSGKGLGLYLAKTQLESMGGEISLTSRPGKGTFVTLKFLNAT